MTADALVLLVEDEALIRMMLEDELADAGFGLVVASDGGRAIEEIEDDPGRFGVIVTDIRLGRGKSGWDVARRARELIPEMPVVYVSGDSAHEWAARGVPKSVMVQKPFAPEEVLTAISTLLGQTGAA